MTPPITPLINEGFLIDCKHQWFEVRKIGKQTSNNEKECKVCQENSTIHTHIESYEYGTLVQCANCSQIKELYGE